MQLVTLLLFERRQDTCCTCEVTLWRVRANIGGFRSFRKPIIYSAFEWIRKNVPLVTNAVLVVLGNISVTINFVLSETVTAHSAVVRKQ
jgi:hypothetical protein